MLGSDNDHNDTDNEHGSYDTFSAKNVRSDSREADPIQQLVNQTILQQLEKLNKIK